MRLVHWSLGGKKKIKKSVYYGTFKLLLKPMTNSEKRKKHLILVDSLYLNNLLFSNNLQIIIFSAVFKCGVQSETNQQTGQRSFNASDKNVEN